MPHAHCQLKTTLTTCYIVTVDFLPYLRSSSSTAAFLSPGSNFLLQSGFPDIF